MTITQKLKTVTPTVLLCILLPVFDVFLDLRLVILLFLGGFTCFNWWEVYRSCSRDPTSYCTDPTTNHGVCVETDDGFRCKDQKDVCGYEDLHKLYATMLLIPFLLNYIISFSVWWKLDNNKKFSFIFALLNLYAPYGDV